MMRGQPAGVLLRCFHAATIGRQLLGNLQFAGAQHLVFEFLDLWVWQSVVQLQKRQQKQTKRRIFHREAIR
jgi:hypothetical protein